MYNISTGIRNSILIKSNIAESSLSVDKFLSNVLGVTSFSLASPFNSNFKAELPNHPCFVCAKLATTDLESIKAVETLGFNLIDTNVRFQKCLGESYKKLPLSSGYSIRLTESEDQDFIGSVAQNNFVYSRFHLDPLIDNHKADLIKRTWVENFYSGQRGDYMVVACFKDSPIGFSQVLCNQENFIIDLIAVDSAHHGKGLASSMITFAESLALDQSLNVKKLVVGTQLANQPSISLYEKLGFRLCHSEYIFHYHSN
jgi:GNAT superfamily N-acetyltransferase